MDQSFNYRNIKNFPNIKEYLFLQKMKKKIKIWKEKKKLTIYFFQKFKNSKIK